MDHRHPQRPRGISQLFTRGAFWRDMPRRNSDAMEVSMWKPKKRHFRETEEWRKKKSRIISKMRTLGRLNLLLVLSKMHVRDFL
ncbi:hypothetical protein Q1695_002426 [Nippostrongylus brasiliensis]|nr:hypothetical protein Q1695_002426 [Nippostrongylus brasiliensis]